MSVRTGVISTNLGFVSGRQQRWPLPLLLLVLVGLLVAFTGVASGGPNRNLPDCKIHQQVTVSQAGGLRSIKLAIEQGTLSEDVLLQGVMSLTEPQFAEWGPALSFTIQVMNERRGGYCYAWEDPDLEGFVNGWALRMGD